MGTFSDSPYQAKKGGFTMTRDRTFALLLRSISSSHNYSNMLLSVPNGSNTHFFQIVLLFLKISAKKARFFRSEMNLPFVRHSAILLPS